MTTRRYDLRAWNEAKRAGLLPEAPQTRADRAGAMRPLTSRQVAARLAKLRCDPLAILAKLAKSRQLDPILRVALARHLAGYQIAPTAGQQTAQAVKDLPSLGDVIADGWRKAKPSAKAKAKPKASAPTKAPKSKR